MSNLCHIFAGGSYDEPSFYKKQDYSYIICADSGLDTVISLGLSPDVVLGDLDSISEISLDLIKSKKVKYVNSDADDAFTDTELAISYAIENNFDRIILFGGFGKRADHFISNVMNLYKYRDYDIRIVDENNEIKFLSKNIEIPKDDSYYSIVAISYPGIRISLDGFKYNLNNRLIEKGSSLGISNEIVEKTSKVVVHSGNGLIIKTRESD